jgi:AcrR family transcriptional regulator
VLSARRLAEEVVATPSPLTSSASDATESPAQHESAGDTGRNSEGATWATGSGARRARRRHQILHAAIELLEAGEYDKIQVRDVAEAAGLSLATIYRYFDSKEQVYSAAILQWSNEFFERVEARGGGGGSTDGERLRSIIRNTLRTLERWPQFIRAVTILDASTDGNAQAHLQAFYDKNLHALRLCVHDLDPRSAKTAVMVVNSVYSTGVRLWAQQRLLIEDVADQLERAVTLIFGPAGDRDS